MTQKLISCIFYKGFQLSGK